MHTITAGDRRETLSTNDLNRLRSVLIDEVERYRFAIRGYDLEKMERFDKPYLVKLQSRVEDVDRILRRTDHQ